MKTFKEISETSEFKARLKKWHKEMRNRYYQAYSCNALADYLADTSIPLNIVLQEYHQFAIKKGLAAKNSCCEMAFLTGPDSTSKREQLVNSFYNEHKRVVI